jgi:hypothetical protein
MSTTFPFRLLPSAAPLAALLTALLLLSACQPPEPPPVRLPELSFAEYGPLVFDVARIDVVDRREQPSGGAARIEAQAPVPPADALRRWAQDRLRAAGSSGTLTVIIKDASITETPLQKTGGIRGTFTTDQSARFDGRIDVELVAEDRGRRYQGFTTATATRSTTMPENASLDRRDRILRTLVEEMMKEVNYRLETGALTHLSSVMRR